MKDDKGNLIKDGEVLYDTYNKKFYCVVSGITGDLITIEENPKPVLLEELKVNGYIKRWIYREM